MATATMTETDKGTKTLVEYRKVLEYAPGNSHAIMRRGGRIWSHAHVDRIESGDILAFATAIEGLDVTHTAFAYRDANGVLRVLHAPLSGGAVEVTKATLPEYVFEVVDTAGLKVVACSNPVDAHFMIQQAIACDDPVVFLEPKRQYHADKAELDESLTLADADPLFSSRVIREGSDLTLLAYGPMVKTCMQSAEAAAGEGKSVEVIDLRTLSPLDMEPVLASVRKTGRAVVAHEAHVNLGMGSEVAARITEECFYSLEAPVLRVGGFDTPYPPSRIEEEWLPDLDRVLDAVDRSLAY